MVIRRVGPMSCGKVGGILYAILGLIFGAGMSLVSWLHVAAGEAEGTGMPVLFGVAAVLLFPILYGAMGFVGSLLMAALYNGVVRLVGGLTIEVE